MKTPAEILSESKPPTRRGKVKMIFKTAIQIERERLHLTCRDVAQAVGLSVACISIIERGGDPLLTSAIKIARFFGRPVESLWEPLSARQ